MEISTWIALGSLVVAVIALLWTGRQQRQINSFSLKEYQRRELMQKQAIVMAQGYKSDRTWVVNISNKGEAPARNIRLQSGDIENDECILLRIEKGKMPYPLLNKDESFEIYAILMEGRNPVPEIKLIWNDESGNDRSRVQVLTFI